MGTGGGKFDVSDRITADRLNRKTLVVDTGANIAALVTSPGMLAFCTATGSGFTAGILYRRNAADGAWEQVIDNASMQSMDNKTLNSPTLNGTIAGSPTFSGNLTFSGILVFSGISKHDNIVDLKVISAPADPATGYDRIYGKAIDASNDGLFIKKKRANSVAEIQIDRAGYQHINTSERSTTNTSATKLKESTLNYTPKNGVLLIKFKLKAGISNTNVQATIYRNGLAVGTDRITPLTTYTTFSEVISAAWASGDTIQVYGLVVGANTCFVSDLEIIEAGDGATATGGF
ncbi:hypothetical protein [Nitrososphaera viennensis]|uniref:Uncharacterized protein n=2 Tax=Nitrososphaera viennensis TaxID=1034015 RepID=A0A060HL65_9ARCH|nr:hypothetical protein [Nitrososphaera viennensis]AIC15930.1 hypothetical protein NVIE_016760 [Nitrososphaera viennensis EN76]UVS67913.1 hypothetical protein NWT39_08350 [Nitrososphaera viennensis]